MHFSIRPAEFRDTADIARLHVEVWRQTYHELAPPAAYAALNEDHRYKIWAGKLSANDPHEITLVAESEGQLLGMGTAGPPSDSVFGTRAEIKHLYIRSNAKRRGIGSRMLSELTSYMKNLGYRAAALSVVEGNAQAIQFYSALEGDIIGKFIDPGPVWRSQNIVYAWDDIKDLISQ